MSLEWFTWLFALLFYPLTIGLYFSRMRRIRQWQGKPYLTLPYVMRALPWPSAVAGALVASAVLLWALWSVVLPWWDPRLGGSVLRHSFVALQAGFAVFVLAGAGAWFGAWLARLAGAGRMEGPRSGPVPAVAAWREALNGTRRTFVFVLAPVLVLGLVILELASAQISPRDGFESASYASLLKVSLGATALAASCAAGHWLMRLSPILLKDQAVEIRRLFESGQQPQGRRLGPAWTEAKLQQSLWIGVLLPVFLVASTSSSLYRAASSDERWMQMRQANDTFRAFDQKIDENYTLAALRHSLALRDRAAQTDAPTTPEETEVETYRKRFAHRSASGISALDKELFEAEEQQLNRVRDRARTGGEMITNVVTLIDPDSLSVRMERVEFTATTTATSIRSDGDLTIEQTHSWVAEIGRDQQGLVVTVGFARLADDKAEGQSLIYIPEPVRN